MFKSIANRLTNFYGKPSGKKLFLSMILFMFYSSLPLNKINPKDHIIIIGMIGISNMTTFETNTQKT